MNDRRRLLEYVMPRFNFVDFDPRSITGIAFGMLYRTYGVYVIRWTMGILMLLLEKPSRIFSCLF